MKRKVAAEESEAFEERGEPPREKKKMTQFLGALSWGGRCRGCQLPQRENWEDKEKKKAAKKMYVERSPADTMPSGGGTPTRGILHRLPGGHGGGSGNRAVDGRRTFS